MNKHEELLSSKMNLKHEFSFRLLPVQQQQKNRILKHLSPSTELISIRQSTLNSIKAIEDEFPLITQQPLSLI